MLYLHFWTNSGQIDGLNMFKSFYIILHPPFLVWTTVLMGSITMNHEKIGRFYWLNNMVKNHHVYPLNQNFWYTFCGFNVVQPQSELELELVWVHSPFYGWTHFRTQLHQVLRPLEDRKGLYGLRVGPCDDQRMIVGDYYNMLEAGVIRINSYFAPVCVTYCYVLLKTKIIVAI